MSKPKYASLTADLIRRTTIIGPSGERRQVMVIEPPTGEFVPATPCCFFCQERANKKASGSS